MRRADNVAIGPDDFEEVELRLLCHRLCLGEIGRGIAGLRDLEGHGVSAFRRGEAIDGSSGFGGTMLELALELADKEGGLFLIPLLEDKTDANENGPGNGGHRCGDGE